MRSILYECETHGRLYECAVDEIGARICPDCGRHVDVLSGEGVL